MCVCVVCVCVCVCNGAIWDGSFWSAGPAGLLCWERFGPCVLLRLLHFLVPFVVCSVQRVVLNNNTIGDKGAKYLADALGPNDTIEEVEVDNNNISDEMMQVSAATVATCPKPQLGPAVALLCLVLSLTTVPTSSSIAANSQGRHPE